MVVGGIRWGVRVRWQLVLEGARSMETLDMGCMCWGLWYRAIIGVGVGLNARGEELVNICIINLHLQGL